MKLFSHHFSSAALWAQGILDQQQRRLHTCSRAPRRYLARTNSWRSSLPDWPSKVQSVLKKSLSLLLSFLDIMYWCFCFKLIAIQNWWSYPNTGGVVLSIWLWSKPEPFDFVAIHPSEPKPQCTENWHHWYLLYWCNCRSLTKVKFSTDQVRPALGSGSWLIDGWMDC